MTIASAMLITLLLTTTKTTVFGDLIVSYRDLAGGQYVNRDTDGFHFDQADLGLKHQFTDDVSGYTRLSMTGNGVSIDEAYIRMEGLPYDGSLTMGRFYKPLGAPIPLASLSFPAIMLHSAPELGLKVNLAMNPVSFEAGLVNGNPLTAPSLGGLVAGSPVMTNANPPNILDIDNARDVYTRLEVNFGEDWGSLTAGATYTAGELSSAELDGLNRGGSLEFGLFPTTPPRLSHRREHLDFDLDYQKGPVRIFSEYVDAQDGRLRRKIFSTAGSYVFFYTTGAVTATLGYDVLNLNAERRLVSQPQTWNRHRVSMSLEWQPNEALSMQAEYDFNREDVIPKGGGDIDNDAFSVQSILSF